MADDGDRHRRAPHERVGDAAEHGARERPVAARSDDEQIGAERRRGVGDASRRRRRARHGRGVDAGLAGVRGCRLGDVLGPVELLDLEDRGAGAARVPRPAAAAPRAPGARAPVCRAMSMATSSAWPAASLPSVAIRMVFIGPPRVALGLRARGTRTASARACARCHRGAPLNVASAFPHARIASDSPQSGGGQTPMAAGSPHQGAEWARSRGRAPSPLTTRRRSHEALAAIRRIRRRNRPDRLRRRRDRDGREWSLDRERQPAAGADRRLARHDARGHQGRGQGRRTEERRRSRPAASPARPSRTAPRRAASPATCASTRSRRAAARPTARCRATPSADGKGTNDAAEADKAATGQPLDNPVRDVWVSETALAHRAQRQLHGRRSSRSSASSSASPCCSAASASSCSPPTGWCGSPPRS